MGEEGEGRAEAGIRDDDYVRDLFDRMGPTYVVMNVVSSFGFSEIWRWQCVAGAGIEAGSRVCDMMAGSGECWKYVRRSGGEIVSVDFSGYMVERQRRRNERLGGEVDVRCENATRTSIEGGSVDHVVGAFALKTLSGAVAGDFAEEVWRVLRPGGSFSFLEISVPGNRWLAVPYRWYLQRVIPMLGKFMLGDIECYRMLGRYTEEFGSCGALVTKFEEAGLEVTLKTHFFGCASSLVGRRRR